FGAFGISLLGLPDEWILSSIDTLRHGDVSLDWHVGVNSLETIIERLFQSGEWLMLLAALSMAVGTVMVRYVSRHADPVSATAWHMIVGGLMLTTISGMNETQQWQYLTTNDWMALTYSSIFGSAIAYGLFFYFASRNNLTSFSALTFLTPVFALLFGNIFLAETLSVVQWIGVGLTLVSIYLINQRDMLAALLQRLKTGLQPMPEDAPDDALNAASGASLPDAGLKMK
ncbi:MAG: DMT family transporter, partial [Cyanobacteria bacterium P01_A01_bin.37]